MQCQNHPNARAIDQCSSCQVPLCGQCASFVAESVLCEPCAANYESEQFVNRQAAGHNKPDRSIQVDHDDTQGAAPRRPSRINPVAVQVGIIATCIVILGARLLFFSGPPANAVDGELVARERRMTSIAQCLIVFRQIGVSLANGEDPDPATTCPDNLGPNRIQRIDDDIVVSHPAPRF